MTTAVTASELVKLARAARELAQDEVLHDPDDDVILIAAAELAEVSVDLTTLDTRQRRAIVRAYDEHSLQAW